MQDVQAPTGRANVDPPTFPRRAERRVGPACRGVCSRQPYSRFWQARVEKRQGGPMRRFTLPALFAPPVWFFRLGGRPHVLSTQARNYFSSPVRTPSCDCVVEVYFGCEIDMRRNEDAGRCGDKNLRRGTDASIHFTSLHLLTPSLVTSYTPSM